MYVCMIRLKKSVSFFFANVQDVWNGDCGQAQNLGKKMFRIRHCQIHSSVQFYFEFFHGLCRSLSIVEVSVVECESAIMLGS